MMLNSTFPSTASMERSKDGTEPIVGGSIASNMTLNNLRDTAGTGVPWRLWLINLYTLFVNVCEDPIQSGPALDAALQKEIQLLVQYIEAYTAHIRGAPRRPDIIFYAPDYGFIPSKLRREISMETKGGKHQHAIDLSFAAFRKTRILRQPALRPDAPLAGPAFIAVGQGSYPHRDLVRWIREHGRALGYVYNQEPVALITHCPIDLHLRRYLQNLFLLERFTGNVLQPHEFGKKISASPDVPFNIYTHQLFGDKVHIASRVSGKLKTTLLDAAKEKNWLKRSEAEILTDILRLAKIEASAFPMKL